MTRGRANLTLGVLLCLFCASHLTWISIDQVPTPHGDSYAYLKNLLDLLDRPLEGHLDVPTSLRTLAVVGRPPLYQLLTLPLVLLLGRSEAVALSINVLFILILTVSTYNIGRLVKDRKVGLVASFLVLTYPPIVHLSRMYLPYFASLACAALSLWLLLELRDRRTIRSAWLASASLAAGLLSHPYFGCMLLAPTLVVGVYVIFRHSELQQSGSRYSINNLLTGILHERFVVLGLAPSAIFALGLPLAWYLTIGSAGFRQLTRISKIDDAYVGFPELAPGFWWYALSAPAVLSNVLVLFFIFGTALALIRREPKINVLLVSIGAAYLFYSALPIRAWWYFACVLPPVAVVTSRWIFSFRNRWLSRGLLLIALLIASFNYSLVTWGAAWPSLSPLAAALRSPAELDVCDDRAALALCSDRARPDPWPWEEIVAMVLSDPDCDEIFPCQLFIAGISDAGRSIMRFIMVRDRLGVGMDVTRLVRRYPVALDSLLLSDYVLYPGDAPGTGIAADKVKFLQHPPPEFSASHRRIAKWRFPDPLNLTAYLIKRTDRLSPEEVRASAAALTLPAEYEFQESAALAGAHIDREDVPEALTALDTIRDPRTRRTTRLFLRRRLFALERHYRAEGKIALAESAREGFLRLGPPIDSQTTQARGRVRRR